MFNNPGSSNSLTPDQLGEKIMNAISNDREEEFTTLANHPDIRNATYEGKPLFQKFSEITFMRSVSPEDPNTGEASALMFTAAPDTWNNWGRRFKRLRDAGVPLVEWKTFSTNDLGLNLSYLVDKGTKQEIYEGFASYMMLTNVNLNSKREIEQLLGNLCELSYYDYDKAELKTNVLRFLNPELVHQATPATSCSIS